MAEQTRTIKIPALTGGISRQPAHVRLAGQTATATNAVFSVEDGMSKRNGSQYVKLIPSAFTLGNVARLHGIDRDGSSRYAVMFGRNTGSGNTTIRLCTTDGATVITPSISADAQTYLNLGSPTADDLRFVTVADYTIIVNTLATPALTTSALYDIADAYRDYDDMLSHQPAEGAYVQTLRDTVTQPKGYYTYSTLNNTYTPRFAYATMTSLTSTTWGTYNQANGYNRVDQNPMGFKIGMRRYSFFTAMTAGQWVATAGANSGGVLTVPGGLTAALNFVAGDQIYIDTTGGGWTVGWYTISAVNVGAGTLTLPAATGQPTSTNSTHSDGIGREFAVTVNFVDEITNDMHDVALAFQRALRRAGCTFGLVNWVKETGAALYGHFVITSQWGGSSAKMYNTSAPVSPTYDMTAALQAFVTTSNTAGSGSVDPAGVYLNPEKRWTRVAAPNQAKAKFTATTMPVRMTRSDPTTFAVAVNTWSDRTSGDQNSNPAPLQIVNGTPIRDVCFFKNRLVFCAGESVFTSQDGDFFNFFANNADNLTDSDPVEISLSDNQVTIIEFMVRVREAILLTTKAGRQFEYGSDGALTPSSVRVTATTNKLTHSNVRPARADILVYMAGPLSNGTAVYEYIYDQYQLASTAGEITAHVPDLIPSSIRRIVTASEQRALLILDSSSVIWHYGAFFNGQNKIQSAWSKWTFDASYTIKDICVIGADVFMLVESQSQYILEKITLGREAIPSGYTSFTYDPHLDRRIALTGSYSNPTTTFTLPDSTSDTTLTVGARVDGSALALTGNGTTSTIAGDYHSGVTVVGRSFTMSTELTRPFGRDQNGVAYLNEKVYLRELITYHANTGTYTLRSVVQNRTDRTKVMTPNSTFSGTTPTTPILETTGRTRAWFNGDAANQVQTIESTSHLPVTISGLEWAAESVGRMA